MARSSDGSNDPGRLWHTGPLSVSDRGLSDGDPQLKGRAKDTANSWSPILSYDPTILGEESLVLWAITFRNVVSEWDFVGQLHARWWCSTRVMAASNLSPAASHQATSSASLSWWPEGPSPSHWARPRRHRNPVGDPHGTLLLLEFLHHFYVGFWPARHWSVHWSTVAVLCPSPSSQAKPACPTLPAWPPQCRPLSPGHPRPCSPSPPWGHQSGPASASRSPRGTDGGGCCGREAGRPAPCLWEGSQGKRPRFPELGGKFPRRCSPGPREVGGGTAPPGGGRAEPGRAVPLPGTDRGAGASRWPPGGDLSPRPVPLPAPFLRELLVGCRWVMPVSPCRDSPSVPSAIPASLLLPRGDGTGLQPPWWEELSLLRWGELNLLRPAPFSFLKKTLCGGCFLFFLPLKFSPSGAC